MPEKRIINIGSEGNAWPFGEPILRPLIERAFPEFRFQVSKSDFQVYSRSHFTHTESDNNSNSPYITWSGESYRVNRKSYSPILEIISDGEEGFHLETDVPTIYVPMLTIAFIRFEGEGYQYPHYKNLDRPYCLAYCNSHSVKYREDFLNWQEKRSVIVFMV